MRFLSSSAFWWLMLAGLIILFYLFKLKRKKSVVPSVLLWRRTMEEMEANTPFRRLRRSLLLFLQLLALAAVVFSLTRPLIATNAIATGSTVVIIDSSASMSARDENGRSRLDRAKEMATTLVADLGGGERAALIESANRVTVRSPLTSDRAALKSAIASVRETDTSGRLSDALRLAEEIAKTERDAGIVVIGDGGVSEAVREAPRTALDAVAKGGITTRFARVGQRADNVGIVALNARPVTSGRTRDLFASIANFSDRERSFTVELRVERRLVDARTVALAAGERRALVFDLGPEVSGLAELKADVEDDLASDNTAYVFLPDARRIRVGVVGDNPFVIQALAVNPDFEVAKFESTAGTASDYDCVVSEGARSSGVLGSRALLAFNPSDADGFWQNTGELSQPTIDSADQTSPVNEYLTYADLHIEKSIARRVAGWLKPIASSGNQPLIWAGENNDHRVVVVGFDLADSDLPLKVEFPMLLANSVRWLARLDSLYSDRVVTTGKPVTIRQERAAAVTTPDGDEHEIPVANGAALFADTNRVGLYQVKDGSPFAATLLNAEESDTTPRDSIRTETGEVKAQTETARSEREVWRWVALLGLAVLSIEWWAYHRGRI
jgi:von Willebrand factor type A domain/Aerotolerance regulator N-terminal